MKLLSLRLFLFTALSCLFLNASAQRTDMEKKGIEGRSDGQIMEFYNKARSSGLSDLQIEQMARSRGYSALDIAKVKERILSLKDIKNETGGIRGQGSDSVRVQNHADDIAKSPLVSEPRSDIFGMEMFKNANLSFEPNLRIATPQNYILGPDDEVMVDIFGYATDSYRLKVSPEGTVKLLNLAPLNVNGLSIEQAEAKIISKLKQTYGGLGSGNTSVKISLGAVRSIKVMVTGEVVRPGTVTVSSLATLFNALYHCGGPTENGTFREIKLIRNNKEFRVIDLYDFLLRADQKDNVGLRDQDVILVGYYKKRISLLGEVKRPAKFEVKEDETLGEVVRFAGSYTGDAYKESIRLTRNTDKEKKILLVNKTEVDKFPLVNGDVVNVGALLERYENRVSVSGAVFRPGTYAILPEMNTVKTLIRTAEGVTENAFLDRTFLYRKTEVLEREVMQVDLRRLLKSEIEDIRLQREDSLVIMTVQELRPVYEVEIAGGVNKPGKFDYVDKMTVSDLVALANGFSEDSKPSRIEISRRLIGDVDSTTTQLVKIIELQTDRGLLINPENQNYILQPYDLVFVGISSTYQRQRNINVSGEVYYPGNYVVKDRYERISNILLRSGGLRQDAYLEGARFVREGKSVAIDLKDILKDNNSISNIYLQDGDSLIVSKVPQLVEVVGAVPNTQMVQYLSRYTVRDYISNVGGFQDDARKRRLYVKYANGTIKNTRKFLFVNNYPKVQPGAQIVVPYKLNDDSKKLGTPEKVAIFSMFGSLAIALATVISRLN